VLDLYEDDQVSLRCLPNVQSVDLTPGRDLKAYAEGYFRRLLAPRVCLLVGRWIGGAAATVVATTIKYFLGLWLAATLVNMWVGVSRPATPSRMRLQLLCSSLLSLRSLPLSFGGDSPLPKPEELF